MTRNEVSKRVVLQNVTSDNIEAFRLLHLSIFPLVYPPQFYRAILAETVAPVKIATLDNKTVVGVVSCRLDSDQKRLYILSLGCKVTFRRCGIGKLLLQHVLAWASCNGIKSVYLHVQAGNEDVLAFYKHHGFKTVETVQRYYPRLDPSDALILEKIII